MKPIVSADRQGRVLGVLLTAVALTSLGAPYVLLQAAGAAVLLGAHGVEGFAIAYLGGAALILPLGWGLRALEARLEGWVAMALAVGIRAAMAFGLFAAAQAGAELAVAYVAAMWARVELILGALAYWGFAARRLRDQADRRWLEWLALCEPASIAIAGVLAPFAVGLIGVDGMFAVAGVSLLAALPPVLLSRFDTSFRPRQEISRFRPPPERTLSPSLRTYLIIVSLAMTVWTVAHYLLEAIFFGLTAEAFDEPSGRFAFISYALAVAGALCFFLLLAGRSDLLRRFGLRVIITVLPLALILVTSLSMAAAWLLGGTWALFVGVTLMKVFEFALVSGFYIWAWRSLFAPLPESQRERLTDRSHRVVHASGAAVAAIALTAVLDFYGFDPFVLLIVFVVVALTGLIIAVFLQEAFVTAIERALIRRQTFEEVEIGSSDRRSREVIQRLLKRGDATDAVEAARLQAALDTAGFINTAPRLIAKGEAGVVKSLLRTVKEVARPELYPPMAGRLLVEDDRELRDALFSAAAATRHPRSPRLLAKAVVEGGDDPPMGALIGLGRYGGSYGEALSSQILQKLALSGPSGLSRALEASSEIGRGAPTGPVAMALKGDDPAMRRKAIRAAGKMKKRGLAPLLVEFLDDPQDWRAATLSLSAIGRRAVDALAQAVGDRSLSIRQRTNAIRALGDIPTPEARAQLFLHMVSRDTRLRPLAQLALWRADVVVARDYADDLKDYSRALMREAAEATLASIETGELNDPILTSGLRQRAQRAALRAIRSSGLLTPRTAELRIRLSSLFGRSRDWGRVSTAAHLLPEDLRPVLEMIRDPDAPGAAEGLRTYLDRTPRNGESWLAKILLDVEWNSDWLRAIALRAASGIDAHTADGAGYIVDDIGPILQDQIDCISRRLKEGDQMALSIVEKVVILKSVDLFSRVPDEDLAEIAPYLTAIFLDPGETVISQGEMGDELYVIVAGEVKVMRDGQEITRLGERDVFGDLAALDPEPRAATVVAVEPTQALVLTNEHLLTLFESNVEIASGVIATLIRRLRRAEAH